jgi:Predicted membrane protein (DUF2339)
MSDYNEKLAQLQQRLDKMVEYQGYFNKEIALLKTEIFHLKKAGQNLQISSQTPIKSQVTTQYTPPIIKTEREVFTERKVQTQVLPAYQTPENVARHSHLEEFVGKNLISIIGIIITVIGVGIGAKYAIDNNLISPATRIIIGYVFAFGLLGFAFKLKENYDKFSAVLLSGAVAIMYFLTYFAYSFYDLIPQIFAFAIMVGITIFTVFAALQYNRQVIAVIGLVGAYGVPFLLSDGSGRIVILFSYISIINLGILAVSVKKYWKFLHISAFALTWLIFIAWFADKYNFDSYFGLAFGFATLFFTIFYASFIAYNLFYREDFAIENIVLILVNSFIYFGLGYAIWDGNTETAKLLGFFTLANAVVHFVVGYLIAKRWLSRETIYFILGLALFFITIAVPIQMDGIWIPIFWTIEAVFLFWVGFAKQIDFYEIASYILMVLATFSVFNFVGNNHVQWSSDYYNSSTGNILTLTPLYNEAFFAGLIFAVGFGMIVYLITRKNRESCLESNIFDFIKIGVSAIFLIALYNLFRTEIGNYWHIQYVKTAVTNALTVPYSNLTETKPDFDGNISLFNIIWQINYTMLFFSVLSFINLKRLKNVGFGFTLLTLNGFVLCIFAVIGLFFISELRESYLLQTNAEKFVRGSSHIIIRYISLGFAAGLIYSSYKLYKQEFIQRITDITAIFETVFAVVLWIMLSSELLNLMDIFGFKDSYKLALSLFWGSYSLILIVLGIWKRKTHLRIGAIALFAFTLAKLFFYDIASLSTISKTVVFISLGVMLLIISFLYNKYKKLIFND